MLYTPSLSPTDFIVGVTSLTYGHPDHGSRAQAGAARPRGAARPPSLGCPGRAPGSRDGAKATSGRAGGRACFTAAPGFLLRVCATMVKTRLFLAVIFGARG